MEPSFTAQPQLSRRWNWNFPLLTVELILILTTIFLILAKHWRLLVNEKNGPFLLVVLIVVGVSLSTQWADVWRSRQASSAEVANVAQRGFFVACTLCFFLIVAFGFFLNHLA